MGTLSGQPPEACSGNPVRPAVNNRALLRCPLLATQGSCQVDIRDRARRSAVMAQLIAGRPTPCASCAHGLRVPFRAVARRAGATSSPSTGHTSSPPLTHDHERMLMPRAREALATAGRLEGRRLHWSASQLNLRACCGTGGAFRGCLGAV